MPGRRIALWDLAKDLRGTTLRQVVDEKISLETRCLNRPKCGRITVWTDAYIKRHHEHHLNLSMEALAEKFRCSTCKTKRLKLVRHRPHQMGDHLRPRED